MRQSRFSDEQMVAILREADRESVPMVAKRHEVSEQTIYLWRKRFGTIEARDVRRLKALETENARLKKLVAERDLDPEHPRSGKSQTPPPCPSESCPLALAHMPIAPMLASTGPRSPTRPSAVKKPRSPA